MQQVLHRHNTTIGAGWGRLDDAAVVKVYEQAGDFKVSSPKK